MQKYAVNHCFLVVNLSEVKLSKSNLIYASLRHGFCFGNELLVCEFATSYVLRLGKLFFLAAHKPYHHYALLASFGLKAKFGICLPSSC